MRIVDSLLGASAGELDKESSERSSCVPVELTNLSYRLGTLRDGVLSQFTRENQSHSSLDLARGDSRFLGV